MIIIFSVIITLTFSSVVRTFRIFLCFSMHCNITLYSYPAVPSNTGTYSSDLTALVYVFTNLSPHCLLRLPFLACGNPYSTLSVCELSIYKFHKGVRTWSVSFCAWLIPLDRMFSWFIHVAANDQISFFFNG